MWHIVDSDNEQKAAFYILIILLTHYRPLNDLPEVIGGYSVITNKNEENHEHEKLSMNYSLQH